MGKGLVGCACYVSMKGAAGRVVLEELLARARLWDVEFEIKVPLFVVVHAVSK